MFDIKLYFVQDFAGAVVEEKMPGVLGGVFLHYAGEGAVAGAPFYTQERIKTEYSG